MRMNNFMLLLCVVFCAVLGKEGDALAPEGEAFKIQSSSYRELCLVKRNPWTFSRSFDPTLTLKKCEQNSTAYARHWLWTRDGALKLKGDNRCLTASRRGVVVLKRCGIDHFQRFQRWECEKNVLKMQNMNAYLVPFNFSTDEVGLFGVLVRSVASKKRLGATVYGGAEWTQYGTGASLCGDLPI